MEAGMLAQTNDSLVPIIVGIAVVAVIAIAAIIIAFILMRRR